MSDTSTIANRYKAELPTILIGLVVLGAVWWFTRLHLPLVGGILACILISPAFPPRYSWISMATVGYGGLAALCYFYYHQTQIAMLLGVVGVIFAASSFFSKGRL